MIKKLSFSIFFAWASLIVGASPCAAHSDFVPSLLTAIPFAGVLFSVAFCPFLIPSLWRKHENFVLIFWAALSIAGCYTSIGVGGAQHLLKSVIFKEYFPFVILISTLYIISGGIRIHINRMGTTRTNIFLLLIGELFSNFIGTTGTSMLLLRPLLEANRNRKYKVHTVVFFIFLVSNIGGCLLPFGDPPLFLGYLKGVDFFWTAKHIFPIFAFVSGCLLLIYAGIDRWMVQRELKEEDGEDVQSDNDRLRRLPAIQITGYFNIFLMCFVVLLVAGTGSLQGKVHSPVALFLLKRGVVRDLGLVFLAFVSYRFSPKVNGTSIHKVNDFSWVPLREVVKFFLAIFITMAPVAIMLKNQHPFFQPLRDVLMQTEHAAFVYFWLVSPFSAFLDNAPTYLVFFKMAGGNAQFLMHQGAHILTAISASSVFMGAATYIGNAPNFMVRSIAKQHGVQMPSFLGYMLWSCGILVPVLWLASYLILY